MSKRTATSELNHDNWDIEEESETPGTFQPLSGSELKNRVIKKAKRHLGNVSLDVFSYLVYYDILLFAHIILFIYILYNHLFVS